MALELAEHVGDLIGLEDLDLRLLDVGRRMNAGDVAGDGCVFDGVGQDAAQEARVAIARDALAKIEAELAAGDVVVSVAAKPFELAERCRELEIPLVYGGMVAPLGCSAWRRSTFATLAASEGGRSDAK